MYLITEFVKNGTLQHRCEKGLNIDQIRRYFRQLILAIEYCHENAGIIHRDIKPENILIDESDNVKLSDFGVSFMMENGMDDIGTSAGSYYYYSPEACLGSVYKGRKSDIWACGVTLYNMLYRKFPFNDNLIPKLFVKIQKDEPIWHEKLDESLMDLLYKLF